ncbi:MAG: hypothetical protein JNM75_03315 [Rhodospirillales bacterium]|nr:hypothetical protein [Rhodospirillales bacterium]
MLYSRIAMLKRFARFIPVIAAAVAVAVALVVLSRVMVTVDTIARPEYRYVYLGGVALLLGGLGVFAWVRLRPRRDASSPRQIAHQRRLSPEARLGEIYERHHLDRGVAGAGAPAEQRRRSAHSGRLCAAVVGTRGSGKSALIAAMCAASGRDDDAGRRNALSVDLVEVPGLSTDFGRNIERLGRALSADSVLFVVDQDLRDYEQDAITALAGRQAALTIVLNKSDLMRPEALAETEAAIAAKLAEREIDADIVITAAAPRPRVRLSGEDDGAEEDIPRPPEVTAIISHFQTLARRRGCSGVRFSPDAG